MAQPAPKTMIDTCNACGKLFPRVSIRLCTGCALVDENRFALVRDYLVDNDGAPVGDIARATGVSSMDVRRFLDGGRLVQVTSGLDVCTCRGVGTRCKHCRSRLTDTFRRMESTMRDDLQTRGGDDREGGRTSYVRRIRRIGEDA